jgi:acetoin utilization protein AcuB
MSHALRQGMPKSIPSVRKYMTTEPITLQPNTKLVDAHKVMKDKHIRHLPVCEGDHVVGMVSDGDLYRAESVSGTDPTKAHLRDVMGGKPYTVSPDAPVDEVVREMAGHKYGSAVVVDNGHVVGVFTATDALGAFADLLQTRLR